MSLKKVDVLVIGGGPSGSSAAYWLSKAGLNVSVLEKKVFPREKTCGDGLTPRTIKQLEDMGLQKKLEKFHRYDGLRTIAHGKTMELAWPKHKEFKQYGYCVRRSDLDLMTLENASEAGATVYYGHEATEVDFEESKSEVKFVAPKSLTGKNAQQSKNIIRTVTAVFKKDASELKFEPKLVIVCEGSNSRIGRKLGVTRNKSYPMGLAARGYFKSDLSTDPWIESHLDLKDKEGNNLPGYGWVFPLGDGVVNVGVGLLSTFKGWKKVNTSKLYEAFVETAPEHWGLKWENELGPHTGGRLPTGGSVSPKTGVNWLLAGDSAGLINPFNGEGISYGYESGRYASEVALDYLKNGTNLISYEKKLWDEFGPYYRNAKLFVNQMGRPFTMRLGTKIGMNSKATMKLMLKYMANLW